MRLDSKSGQKYCAPKLPGFRFLYSPRKLGRRQGGGGVGFYVRRSLNVRNFICPTGNHIEQMWTRLTLNLLHIIVGTANASCSIHDFVDAQTDTIKSFSRYNQLVLVGDYNVNLLDCNEHITRQLIFFLDNMNINNYVAMSTHFISLFF